MSVVALTQGKVALARAQGDDMASATVKSVNTEARAYLNGDESGFVEVHREGTLIHRFNIASRGY